MTVFKGILLGALRQRAVILLYLAIFLGLGTLMTSSQETSSGAQMSEKRLTIAVTDQDKSTLSLALTAYLAGTQAVIKAADNQAALSEELYYGNIEYVLRIPDGFEADFCKAVQNGGKTEGLLEGTGRAGSNQSYYVRALAEGYLSGLSVCVKAGYTVEEAARYMENAGKTEASVTLRKGSREMTKLAETLQYLPYVLTALSCYVIGFVMLDYQREDMQRRLAASGVSFLSRLGQMLLAFLAIGLGFYVISFLMVWVMNPTHLFSDAQLGLYALNILAMVLVGLAIAFLVICLVKSAKGVNGLANVLALGMSFICGVFIPSSLLSESVQTVSKFLPVYWYEQNNTLLGTHTALTESLRESFAKGIACQLFFAAAVILPAVLLRKRQARGRKA